ncbi:hypothetical protein Ahy_A10g049942 [Arachis hypogaea]|uniref:Aminotransferase-like plant mobile domain-containing protein n=1 Tax=Arachis hypogaea TaxID=3818 RepID=A0A445B880_ARAHY|nr:hypothetical protein Ahy_A10g049942 [Arachis hypogaea]
MVENCIACFGREPGPYDHILGKVNLAWFRRCRDTKPCDTQESIERYVQVHIFCMLGTVVFPNKPTTSLNSKFLPLLCDFHRISLYSWGVASLAHLYRSLYRASRYNYKEMDEPLILLFIWAWERMPFLAPILCGVIGADIQDIYGGLLRILEQQLKNEQQPEQQFQSNYILDSVARAPLSYLNQWLGGRLGRAKLIVARNTAGWWRHWRGAVLACWVRGWWHGASLRGILCELAVAAWLRLLGALVLSALSTKKKASALGLGRKASRWWEKRGCHRPRDSRTWVTAAWVHWCRR